MLSCTKRGNNAAYNQEKTEKVLAILAIIILVVLVGHIVYTTSFNNKVHTAKGADESKSAYMSFANRDDSTSSWVKRDFDLYGKTVDLQANTIDGTFFNHAGEEIVSWKMKLKIKGDCFINNAWCGTMEIHQFVGIEGEKVQKLDLRNYNLDDVKLEYLYDGDLLIPLKKGDYLIYYPSEKFVETAYPFWLYGGIRAFALPTHTMWFVHTFDL